MEKEKSFSDKLVEFVCKPLVMLLWSLIVVGFLVIALGGSI